MHCSPPPPPPQDPIFENCSCIADSLWQGSSHGVIAPSIASLDELLLLSNSTAANAQCPEECDKLPVFLVSVGLVLYLVFILKIPSVIITLRSGSILHQKIYMCMSCMYCGK